MEHERLAPFLWIAMNHDTALGHVPSLLATTPIVCVKSSTSRYSNIKSLGLQSFDARNVCIHGSGLLLFAPNDDGDDTIDHLHMFLISNIFSSNKGYGFPVTIIRNEVYPSHFQHSASPQSLLLLAAAHPMTQVGHHMFESILSAFVSIKAAAMTDTSHTHVIFAGHFADIYPAPPSSPIEATLRSMWTSLFPHSPMSVGNFLNSTSASPGAPVCYRRAIIGAVQDKGVLPTAPHITNPLNHQLQL